MNDSEKAEGRPFRLERYVWALAVVWTAVVAAAVISDAVQIEHNAVETARIQARAAHQKDVIYRRWNAGHGGIYVPVTATTQPNPHLSDVPERDITLPSGRLLTLMNPAYMTRQVHELGEAESRVRGHITSLNPIRPENAPDPWEAEALQAFERGEIEVSSLEEVSGEEHIRLMRPLITEKGCLKCHAAQGYQEGDIRGGISVSIPMEPLREIARTNVLTLVLGHGALWLMGVSGIFLGTRRLSREVARRNRAEQETRRHAVQLEAAKERAEEADRLKSTFLATMSHELRTPLNSIIGFTGIVLQGLSGPLNDEQSRQLGIARDSGRHLLALINDVLDLSKIEAGEVEIVKGDFAVPDLIEKVVNTVSPLAEQKGLELTVALSPEVGQIYSDRRRVEQILLNLVNNAIKFTERGRVRIEGTIVEEYLRVSVEDTGIGIKAEDMGTLFQTFRQVQTVSTRDHEGTGLGLSICKKLVTMLGGEIWAESEWGVGSKFTFTLPMETLATRTQKNKEMLADPEHRG